MNQPNFQIQEQQLLNIRKGIAISSSLIQISQPIIHDTIGKIKRLTTEKERLIQLIPFQFNVISAATRGKLRETGHSMILANLLKVPAIRKSFLSYFLGIEIEETTSREDVQVHREYGTNENRIDVTLSYPHHFIIIENKVNSAEEQPHQLYNYVHRIAIDKDKRDIDQIYVIYLNPTSHSEPSIQSITNEEKTINIKEELKDRFIVRSYAYDIVSWLTSLQIPPNEEYLQSGIQQYIHYLKIFFQTEKSYTKMNNELEQLILKEYNLDQCAPETAVENLKQEYANLTFLRERVQSLIVQKQLSIIYNKLKEDYTCDSVQILPVTHEDSLTKVGIRISKNSLKGTTQNLEFYIAYEDYRIENIESDSNKALPFYGIFYVKSDNIQVYQSIQELYKEYPNNDKGNEMKESPNWPLWNYCSFNSIYEQFKTFINYIYITH